MGREWLSQSPEIRPVDRRRARSLCRKKRKRTKVREVQRTLDRCPPEAAFLTELRTTLRMFEDTECPEIIKRRLAAILRKRCDAYLFGGDPKCHNKKNGKQQ